MYFFFFVLKTLEILVVYQKGHKSICDFILYLRKSNFKGNIAELEKRSKKLKKVINHLLQVVWANSIIKSLCKPSHRQIKGQLGHEWGLYNWFDNDSIS